MAKNKDETDIHHQLSRVYSVDAMSRPIVSRWFKLFIVERRTLHDEQQSVHTSTSHDLLVGDVSGVVDIDLHQTLDKIHS